MTTKTLYTARAHATNGREGHAETDDKKISVELSRPGSDGAGTNPEQLFACGYAACFGGAVAAVARTKKLTPGEVTVQAEVSLLQGEDGYAIRASLDVLLPDLKGADAIDLVREAHQVCPYSKATRGNIEVTLKANGEAVS